MKDKRVLALVKAFLKAGILTELGDWQDTHTGTPQGGILSPLIFNIAMSALDEHLHRPWKTGGDMSTHSQRLRRRRNGLPTWRVIRYADDFVVLVHGGRGDAEALREEIARVLEPLGLRLSPAKTRIVHMSEAFDFLGFRIQWRRKRGTTKWYVYTFIAIRSIRAVKAKIRALTHRTSQRDLGYVLTRINMVLHGWASGRDVDILLTGPDRSYYIECTVITESDEDQQVHDEWLEARKATPDLLLARPGPFDSATAKGPSPYYDANRFYIKVFDKLQKDGDPAQSQTSPDCPNILLLSCFPIHSAPLPFSPGLKWALDELFSGQPNMGAIKQMPPGTALPDISLLTFLTRQWPATATDLLQSPAGFSGALIFNCLGLQGGRINYNANAAQQVSHLEMTFLEAVFSPARGWENVHPPMRADAPEEPATPSAPQ